MPGALLRLVLAEGPAPAFERLRILEPGLRRFPTAIEIPLDDRAPEELLALCLRCGITARATRVVPAPPSG